MPTSTNPAATSTPNTEWQQLDDLAHALANKNEVELCWLLRGMNDAANRRDEADTDVPHGYRGFYASGWNSASEGDVITEALARETLNRLW